MNPFDISCATLVPGEGGFETRPYTRNRGEGLCGLGRDSKNVGAQNIALLRARRGLRLAARRVGKPITPRGRRPRS
jgi:hypothetical protein